VNNIIKHNLQDNKEWIMFAKTTINPLLLLQKGKLCQDGKEENSSLSEDTSSDLFDDDFMKGASEFGMADSGLNDRDNSDLSPEKQKE
jgi:hypothetical protein